MEQGEFADQLYFSYIKNLHVTTSILQLYSRWLYMIYIYALLQRFVINQSKVKINIRMVELEGVEVVLTRGLLLLLEIKHLAFHRLSR